MPHERSPAMPASVGAGPGDATEASAAQGTEPAVSHDRPLRFCGVSASILVRRLQGGECLAAVGIDLATNRVVKAIPFSPDVALKTTYLNDVRFDLRKGKGGVAYITDSSQTGPNGVIVVDTLTSIEGARAACMGMRHLSGLEAYSLQGLHAELSQA